MVVIGLIVVLTLMQYVSINLAAQANTKGEKPMKKIKNSMKMYAIATINTAHSIGTSAIAGALLP